MHYRAVTKCYDSLGAAMCWLVSRLRGLAPRMMHVGCAILMDWVLLCLIAKAGGRASCNGERKPKPSIPRWQDLLEDECTACCGQELCFAGFSHLSSGQAGEFQLSISLLTHTLLANAGFDLLRTGPRLRVHVTVACAATLVTASR